MSLYCAYMTILEPESPIQLDDTSPPERKSESKWIPSSCDKQVTDEPSSTRIKSNLWVANPRSGDRVGNSQPCFCIRKAGFGNTRTCRLVLGEEGPKTHARRRFVGGVCGILQEIERFL